VDALKTDIDSINYNIDQIANLHNNALGSFNELQSKQTARQLENIKMDTQRKNMSLKNRIRGNFFS
jgi:syntaxin 1B/2/3